jgi:hypothetical protein
LFEYFENYSTMELIFKKQKMYQDAKIRNFMKSENRILDVSILKYSIV